MVAKNFKTEISPLSVYIRKIMSALHRFVFYTTEYMFLLRNIYIIHFFNDLSFISLAILIEPSFSFITKQHSGMQKVQKWFPNCFDGLRKQTANIVRTADINLT